MSLRENKQKSAVTEGLLHTGRQHALTVNNWNEVYTHNERGKCFITIGSIVVGM